MCIVVEGGIVFGGGGRSFAPLCAVVMVSVMAFSITVPSVGGTSRPVVVI